MKIYIVNAFTAHGKNGNPAGVVIDADDLTPADMQRIAAQMKLSEVAFVGKSKTADRRVRFFTPTVEEKLCGHATIATWSLLHELHVLPAGHYTQETGAGVLRIRVHDDGMVFMEQAPAQFFETITPAEIAPLLGIDAEDLHAALPPQIVSTGLRDLMVPVTDKQVLARLRPDLNAVAAWSEGRRISGFHVFALLEGQASATAARNFAPADGIPEECATGTSTGAMFCYLKQHRALPEQDVYRAEQGEAMGRLSYLYGVFHGDTIWIGGHAAVAAQRQI